MLEGDQLRCARLATRSLAEVVETSFGPQPREKLLVSAVGRVLITSSGASILRSLVTEPAESPVARYMIDCALRHAERAGEGATAFILMADAALCSIDAVLAPLPPARRRAEQARLAQELTVLGCHTLPAVLEPDWRLACLPVPLCSLDPHAAAVLLRQVGLAIVGTSLGAAFSGAASAAVCSSLVGALLPQEEDGEAGRGGEAAAGQAAHAGGGTGAFGVWRRAQARAAGGVAVVGAAGQAVGSSTALRGLLLRARRIDEIGMPQSCQAVGVLFLGPRALPPDAPGAQPSHPQATLRVHSSLPAASSLPPSRPPNAADSGAGLGAGVGGEAGVRVRTDMSLAAGEGAGEGEGALAYPGVSARPALAPPHAAQPSPPSPATPEGCPSPFGLSDAAAWAATDAERWVAVARAAGVGLILSCSQLSPRIAQLCSASGIAAAEGIDLTSMAPLMAVARVQPMRRWPRPAELRQLLETGTAPHLLRGCEFCFEQMGGQAWVRLVPHDASVLRTALLRAPTEGLVREYVRAAHCAMRTLRVWLGEVGHDTLWREGEAGGVGMGRHGDSRDRGTGEGGERGGGAGGSGQARGVGPCDGQTEPSPGGGGSGLPRGARVIIVGLTGAPRYNGMHGVVLGWEAARARYAVHVDEGAGGAAADRNQRGTGPGGKGCTGARSRAGQEGWESAVGESRPSTSEQEDGESAGECAHAPGESINGGGSGGKANAPGGKSKTLLLKPSSLILFSRSGASPRPSMKTTPPAPDRRGPPGASAAPVAGGTGRDARGGTETAETHPWPCQTELLCMAGGGAAELKLDAMVRRLLRLASPRASRPDGLVLSKERGWEEGIGREGAGQGWDIDGRGDGAGSIRDGAGGSRTDSDGVHIPMGALRVLSAALLAIPRQLHANAGSCAASVASTPGGGAAGGDGRVVRDGRWMRVLQVLQQAHDRSIGCRLGIVVQTAPPAPCGGAGTLSGTGTGTAPCSHSHDRPGSPFPSHPWPVQWQRVGDAADALVIHTYAAKLQAVHALLSCLGQLLRIDGIVPAVRVRRGSRRGAGAGRTASAARRRRVGSAFESSSESSEGEGRRDRGGSDSSGSEDG